MLRRWLPADVGDLADALLGSTDLDRQVPAAALAGPQGRIDVVETMAAWGPADHYLAVELDGRVVGTVAACAVEHRHGTAWISYWLAEPARGQGLATRALATMAVVAFDELGLHRLELGHRVDNPASCAVARRAGFLAEGVERGKLRYGDRRFDVETHARLRGDPLPPVDLLPVR